jgi:hypothetical protein
MDKLSYQTNIFSCLNDTCVVEFQGELGAYASLEKNTNITEGITGTPFNLTHFSSADESNYNVTSGMNTVNDLTVTGGFTFSSTFNNTIPNEWDGENVLFHPALSNGWPTYMVLDQSGSAIGSTRDCSVNDLVFDGQQVNSERTTTTEGISAEIDTINTMVASGDFTNATEKSSNNTSMDPVDIIIITLATIGGAALLLGLYLNRTQTKSNHENATLLNQVTIELSSAANPDGE